MSEAIDGCENVVEGMSSRGNLADAEKLRLFSYLFDDPSEEFAETVNELAKLYADNEEATGLLSRMSDDLEEAGKGMVDLRVDHAKLFIGPFEMLAPPYASLYLEDGARVYGEVTCAIKECYRRAGLVQRPELKEPEDHIARLLEFLYYLNYKYIQTGDDAYDNEFREFDAAYVSSWRARFFENIEKNAQTDFYRALARLGLHCLPLS